MEVFMLATSKTGSHMVRARSNTMSLNPMISSITKAIGKTVCPTDLVKLTTIMATFTKGILLTVKDKVMDRMYLTKYIDMKANGKITISLAKENFLEMDNFSLKANSNMDLSMALESINMKMGTTLKEIISKTKKEEKESTIFTKAAFCNPNLTLGLRKFPESN
jgi:hypothetical protein